ncbi:MAG: phosphate acyltransferase PlsX [Phycisphaerales bacterium]
MRLCIDVMGGDHAPDAILSGCVQGLAHLDPGDRLVLVGDEREITELLHERGCSDARMEIVHASEVIGMDESPVEAVRGKKDSSIVRMALLGSVKAEKRCDVVLSAGNTGACVAAATMHMRRLPGVHRPGIAVTIPSFAGPVVMSDVGGNPEPRPSHLWQYGIMADAMARSVLGIKNPRVSVLNIGSEEAKGTDLIKQTAELLKATPGLNYCGYVEGREVFNGGTDVVVTDGFVGNALLKMIEGMAKSFVQAIAHEIMESQPDAMITLEPTFKRLFAKMDYHEYGGAPLLGVNGICVIAHGSSEARTIRSAIRNAKAFHDKQVNEAIVKRIAEVNDAMGSHVSVGS